jgi:hypothetical protein
MPDRGWQRFFDDPIPLPNGRRLVTLRDAATFITKLPKAEHDAEEWAGRDAGAIAELPSITDRRCSRGSVLTLMQHQGRRFAAIHPTQLPSPERYRGANEPQLGP